MVGTWKFKSTISNVVGLLLSGYGRRSLQNKGRLQRQHRRLYLRRAADGVSPLHDGGHHAYGEFVAMGSLDPSTAVHYYCGLCFAYQSEPLKQKLGDPYAPATKSMLDCQRIKLPF